MNLRSIGIALCAVLAMGLTTACSKVPAGNVGVKVYLLGSSKGVDVETLGPGRYWIGWNEDLYLFPTFTQNYTWTKEPDETGTQDESISFQTNDGMDVSADVGISYNIDPDKAATVFQKYRKGVTEITDIYLRNMVRDAMVSQAARMKVESVYGEGKAELIKAVEASVRAQVAPIGIRVERIYWASKLTLPKQVVDSINAKIQATQKAQMRENEIQTSIAEAQKQREAAKGQADARITVAKGEAEANRLVSESLTQELVKYRTIQKWNGVQPQVMSGNGGTLIGIDLK